MSTPLNILFRHPVPGSDDLERTIEDHVEKLGQIHDRLTSCRVVIDTPHANRSSGRLFHVDIELAVPGRLLCVTSGRDDERSHERAEVAVGDAFRTMRRRLRDHAERQRA